MKTIGKTLTGILLAGALALGTGRADAQSKVSIETQAITNTVGSGLPFHRTTIETQPITIRYDKTIGLGKNAKDPADAGAIFFNNLYSDSTSSLNAYAINVGSFNREDEQFFGAWASKKVEETELTFEVGKSARKTGPSREWGIAKVRGENISGDLAYFAQGSTFGKEDKFSYYMACYHDKNTYVGGGDNNGVSWTFGGIHGFEDFGTFAFGKHDPKTGEVWIKSQTAVSDVNKSFYNAGLFDFAADYLTLPAFFPIHFSPISTKGSAALKLEYKNFPSRKKAESEIMVATNQTPIQVGVGINTEYNPTGTTSGVALELYKDFNVAGIKGDFEVKYNGRTKDLQAYLKAGYAF